MVFDRLLLLGYVEERHEIGADLVEMVMRELRQEGLLATPGAHRGGARGVTLVLTIPPKSQGSALGPHATHRSRRCESARCSATPAGRRTRSRRRSGSNHWTTPRLGTASSRAAPAPRFSIAPAGRTVIERSFGHHCHFLQAKRDGRITGVLPLVHVSQPSVRQRADFRRLRRLRRPARERRGQPRGPQSSRRCSSPGDLDVDYLEYRLRAPSDLPWARNSGSTRPSASAWRRTPTTILHAVPRKRRAMLRKALALGLKSELDRDIDRFYSRLFAPRPRSWHASLPSPLTFARSWRCSARTARS